MAGPLDPLDQDIIDFLVDLKENSRREFKRMLKRPTELLPSVVAFANTKWGYLALWIEDSSKASGTNRLIGINEWGDNYAEFLTALRRNIQPELGNNVDVSSIGIINTKGENDKIVLVRVYPNAEIYSTLSGDTFMRTDNSNKKIGGQEIIRLKYEKWSLKYEDEISDIDSLDELDKEIFEEFKFSIKAGGEDRQVLKDNWLAYLKDGKRFLRKSGVLLFAKNPTIALSNKCWIRISHYYGNYANFSWEPNFRRRPFTIEWPIKKQIIQCTDFFSDLIRETPPILWKDGFQSTLRIPLEVIQEAITNAVIHRNYAIQNDIQVRIFDDRVEIESPWVYPGHITPGNIKDERYSRNPTILRALRSFWISPNLDIWEWVDRMFLLMDKGNLNPPRYSSISQKPYSVLVTLLNAHKMQFVDTIQTYILENWLITNKEARAITGIWDTLKVSRLLKQMVESGILKVEWEKRHTVYRLADDSIRDVKLNNV